VVAVLSCRDQAGPGGFTAVNTAGWADEVQPSPTSPRVKHSPANSSLSGGTPLLKAALTASMNRLPALTSSPGTLQGIKPAIAALQQQLLQHQQQQHSSISANVKQRLKDYFVSRNTELLATGPGALGGGEGTVTSESYTCGDGRHHGVGAGSLQPGLQ